MARVMDEGTLNSRIPHSHKSQSTRHKTSLQPLAAAVQRKNDKHNEQNQQLRSLLSQPNCF